MATRTAGEDGYRSEFDKQDEYATAGYYSVILKDYGIRAELTATERVGFHRYTFPASDQAHLIFDIGRRWGESGRVVDAEVQYNGDGTLQGCVITEPAYVQKYQPGAVVPLYFYAQVSRSPEEWGTFAGEAVQPSAVRSMGPGSGIYMTFTTVQNETIEVKVGVSYTSVDNARNNLMTEAENLTFDQARRKADGIWEEALGRIVVEGPDEADKTKFYTGLFHALLGRGLASDVNGDYPRNDGTVGRIEKDADGRPLHHHYNTDAMWGGCWNLTLLWALAYPEYYADFVQSQLLVYKETGWLADGSQRRAPPRRLSLRRLAHPRILFQRLCSGQLCRSPRPQGGRPSADGALPRLEETLRPFYRLHPPQGQGRKVH